MGQRTLSTVSRDDVNAVIPAFQSRLPVIQPKMASWFLRTMTTQAGGFEDGPDITFEVNFTFGRRWQPGRIQDDRSPTTRGEASKCQAQP